MSLSLASAIIIYHQQLQSLTDEAGPSFESAL